MCNYVYSNTSHLCDPRNLQKILMENRIFVDIMYIVFHLIYDRNLCDRTNFQNSFTSRFTIKLSVVHP